MMINNSPVKKSIEGSPVLANVQKTKTPIGAMYCMSESQVKGSQLSMDQSFWFLLFLETLSHHTVSQKFLELRNNLK